jgi:co-chaperonin GroES (HSP10)
MRPLRDLVVIEMPRGAEKVGRVFLPKAKEWPWEKVCRFVSQGPDANLSLKAGDLIVIAPYRGDPIENRHEGFATVKAEFVVAKVDAKTAEAMGFVGSPRDDW